MSTFVTLLHRELSSRVLLPPPSSPAAESATASAYTNASRDALRTYLAELNPPISLPDARACLDALHRFEQGDVRTSVDGEDEALQTAVLVKLLIGLYVQTLEVYLDEASDAETQLEWWADIERSRIRSAYYLVQTLPLRIYNVVDTVIRSLRRQNLPLQLSSFTPTALQQFFPSRSALRPHGVTLALFPHLRREPYPASLFVHTRAKPNLSFSSERAPVEPMFHWLHTVWARASRSVYTTLTLPIELSRHECRYKLKMLEEIRDDRASVLGHLLELRDDLSRAAETTDTADRVELLQSFVVKFRGILAVEGLDTAKGLSEFATLLTNSTIPRHVSAHNNQITTHELRKPSRLTRYWPRLVFLPPVALVGVRWLYNSRESLEHTAVDAVETLKAFWDDWLLGPLKEIVKTVRTGSDEGVIVTKESVKSDLESLERMTLALAKEKLNYTAEQMAALSEQVRHGDLTAVMQIYEDDIRNPLKSAIGGTLLRTLLVQVQKAKVDIDQALSGIDKLLKSQELTFAFVGVAPAMTLVYFVGSYLNTLWSGSKGRGRYGGSRRRARVWSIMRRIERLLVSSSSPSTASTGYHAIDSRTSGLMLLLTTRLRSYAEMCLPSNSRLRGGFLEDVAALEDPVLGRNEKLRIVDRMWNSWGTRLGWYDMGKE
ncbi:NCA2 domain-containing protein [Phanerochaete sordida]|uniref:NCA2 domain-containing protein n=1 Tax=Phanerochaete sordida TaxID=48140 RepID=A0A9P3GBT5_9APHY|nr:NCA2 domain-containing protein [Phanerochaete sordida]